MDRMGYSRRDRDVSNWIRILMYVFMKFCGGEGNVTGKNLFGKNTILKVRK